MNCAQHPDRPLAAYCRTCGKAICETCKREVRNVIYCEDCLASRVQAAMPSPGAVPGHSGGGPYPPVAGVLAGLLPFGVAPVYNGQYSRGLVYLAVFILLTWGCDQSGFAVVVFGIAMAAFFVWQIIDAVRSAHYIRAGLPAPDPFGLDRLFSSLAPPPAAGPAPSPWPNAVPPAGVPYSAPAPVPAPVAGYERHGGNSRIPFYALLLIVLGVMFLLGNLGISSGYWPHRFWPLILIVIGGWLLHTHWGEIASGTPVGRRRLMGPAVLLALGAGFLVDDLLGLSIVPPLLLIVIGLVMVWQRTLPPDRAQGPPPGVAPTPNINAGQNRER